MQKDGKKRSRDLDWVIEREVSSAYDQGLCTSIADRDFPNGLFFCRFPPCAEINAYVCPIAGVFIFHTPSVHRQGVLRVRAAVRPYAAVWGRAGIPSTSSKRSKHSHILSVCEYFSVSMVQ